MSTPARQWVWELGDDNYSQADINFTAFMATRPRRLRQRRTPLFIPFDEMQRRRYDQETEQLRLIIRGQHAADERRTA